MTLSSQARWACFESIVLAQLKIEDQPSNPGAMTRLSAADQCCGSSLKRAVRFETVVRGGGGGGAVRFGVSPGPVSRAASADLKILS
jgi:hypothetical protein